jgi:hypothetical protein
VRTDQTFAANNASMDATFELGPVRVTDAVLRPAAPLTVTYNAGNGTYTVVSHGQSQSFGPAALQGGGLPGETLYQVTSGSTVDFLTLATTPYTGTKPNKYVALGYWQRAQLTGSTQTNTFDEFVYGFATPTAAVPRSGLATYATDAFGLLTRPGAEPMVFSGSGTFDVDLENGVFRSSAMVGEYALESWDYAVGGQLVLQSGGTIGSENGFSGNFSFTDLNGTIGGAFDGRFFGPAGQEIGASFSGQNSAGATIAGAMTGQLDPDATPPGLALDTILNETVLPEHFVEFLAGYDTSLTPVFRGVGGGLVDGPGTVTLHPDGSATVHLLSSFFGEVTLTDADRSAVQKPYFDSYDVLLAATPTNPEASVHVDLAKRGSANDQIELTYASFGVWTEDFVNGTYSQTRKDFFVYGQETPANMLAGRTGNASYSGIIQGTVASPDGVLGEVGGTSTFNVDFAAQTYSGALDVLGESASGTQELGTWTFDDTLARGFLNPTTLHKVGSPQPPEQNMRNAIQPHFYGPYGEEIAAPFTISTGWPGDPDAVSIAGVAVAKQN